MDVKNGLDTYGAISVNEERALLGEYGEEHTEDHAIVAFQPAKPFAIHKFPMTDRMGSVFNEKKVA